MPKELDRYTHLRYGNEESNGKDFVDFLYDHTEVTAPEVDVDDAWKDLQMKIDGSKTKSNSWMRIAASIAVIIGASIFIWTLSTTPEQVNISSLDEKINVTFPDGSTGILNANSSFSFQDKFGDERLVAFEGEAYFDIKKSDKPFIIEMGGVKARVLGTAFNLVTSEENVILTVERGLVAFEKEEKLTKVKAGLKAIYSKKDQSVSISEATVANIASWIDGKLEFNDPLDSVIEDLAAHFGVKFEVTNEKINDCNVTGTFDKNTLPEILDTIESFMGVQIDEKEDGVYVISGEGC